MPKKLLFVCNQGQNRSRTGAEMYARKGYETDYAGIYSDTRPLTAEMLEWADLVFVFERNQLDVIKARWPDLAFAKPIVNLGVNDFYCHGDPELKAIIRKGVEMHMD
jgi:predicted protein tyrosine phosphatase